MAISLDSIYAGFALVLGYLLGSIPFGLILTRLAGTPDLRAIGSGNIGATNVLRTGRKDLAAATLVLDALKATLAVVLSAILFGPTGGARRRGGRVFRPSLPRLAAPSRRQGRGDVSRRVDRRLLACCGRVRDRLARGGGFDPLLLGGGARRKRRGAARGLGDGADHGRLRLRRLALLLWVKHSANIARLIAGTETKIGGKG